MNPIIEKMERRFRDTESLLCVGLDPVMEKLPTRFRTVAHPLFAFNKFIIEASAPYAAAYKLNSAFYERHGAHGIDQLAMTIQLLRSNYPSIINIFDAKRGDTANTNEAYATAIFDMLGFDAVTLHPYLGQEAMMPFLVRRDKACIFLCRTSNAGAFEFQDLMVDGVPLWQVIAERITHEWDSDGNCMLVVGATYPEEMRRLRQLAPRATFLVPGIGTQGGDVDAVLSAGLNSEGMGLILSSSREIIYAEDPATAAGLLRERIRTARKAVHAAC